MITPLPRPSGTRTITVAGGYRIHIFNSSGTFTASGSCQIKYLVIAGGGAGGTYCAGGGAGGFLQGTVNIASGAYPITVGLGGTNFNNGGDSLFGSIAHAIGGGAAQGSLNSNGNSGGSGAGGSGFTGNGGSPTAGQGYAGGHGGNDDNRLAELNRHGTVRLLGEFAGFDGDVFVADEGGNFLGHN